MKLKSMIIIKKVNEDVIFALDLADTQDRYYKFEGASSVFLKMISAEASEEKIIEEILKNFDGTNPEQIKNDLTHFITKLESLSFLA